VEEEIRFFSNGLFRFFSNGLLIKHLAHDFPENDHTFPLQGLHVPTSYAMFYIVGTVGRSNFSEKL